MRSSLTWKGRAVRLRCLHAVQCSRYRCIPESVEILSGWHLEFRFSHCISPSYCVSALPWRSLCGSFIAGKWTRRGGKLSATLMDYESYAQGFARLESNWIHGILFSRGLLSTVYRTARDLSLPLADQPQGPLPHYRCGYVVRHSSSCFVSCQIHFCTSRFHATNLN